MDKGRVQEAGLHARTVEVWQAQYGCLNLARRVRGHQQVFLRHAHFSFEGVRQTGVIFSHRVTLWLAVGVHGANQKHLFDTRSGRTCQALMPSGRTRHVGVVVPSFLAVLPLLEQTDYIALLPSRCISPTHHSKLAVFEPPIALEGFGLHLAWHQRRDADPATQHVANVLRQVTSLL